MRALNILYELLDINGIKRSLWIFISDYILFIDNKLFALIRGVLFNLISGRLSVAFVHKNCEFYSFKNIILGKNVVIMKGCRLSGPLDIGEYAVIYEKVTLSGPTKLGKYCQINYGAWIDKYVEMEDYSGVAHRSFLISFSHEYSDPECRWRGVLQYKPIRICKGVWVGANVVILKGVRVGAGSIISSGAVVTKDVPEHVIAAGNPCKVIRELPHSKTLIC